MYMKNINVYEKLYTKTYILKEVNHVFGKCLTCIKNVHLYTETIKCVWKKVDTKTYIWKNNNHVFKKYIMYKTRKMCMKKVGMC